VSETSEYATGIEYWYVVFKRKAKYTISVTSPTADYTFRTGARRR
jgi:hypothetical protein